MDARTKLRHYPIVECVQRGMRSRLYTRGRYSPTREQGVHQFHSLIARSLSQG